MRLLLLFVFTLSLSNNISVAQTTINMSNGSSESCNAILFDAANTADYGPNEDFIYTICPAVDSLKTEIEFTSFDLHPSDSLCIYDGVSTSDSLVGCFTSTTLQNVSFTANDSCLTFHFFSDTSDESAGFQANVSCSDCQQINPSTSSSIASTNGVLDICVGDQIAFTNTTTYPQNNWFYNQSNATSTYNWDMFNSSSTDENTTKTFNTPGYYPINLEVTDANGCERSAQVMIVRVSGAPDFSATTAMPTELCVGDSFFLNGSAIPNTYSFTYGTVGDSAFLDDIPGGEFEVSINVNQFNAGQTISAASDIVSVCVNMEHSYMGDLIINLTCPDGNSIEFHNDEGFGTFLGEPIDIDGDNTPGVGYTYCWDMSSFITWADFTDLFTSNTLPEGNYAPNESFSGLVGCPLNGDWVLSVEDDQFSDNGYIFNWSINFDQSIFPNQNQNVSFTPQIVSDQWLENSNTLTTNSTYAQSSTTVGSNTYTYEIEDDFGCTFSTDFQIEVGEPIVFNISDDLDVTSEAPLFVNFTNNSTPNNASYSWFFDNSNFSNNYNPIPLNFEEGGEFEIKIIASSGACIDSLIYPIAILAVDTPANVFTPNQDGYNDAFFLPAVGIRDYSARIYNRWGKQVFECGPVNSTQSCSWDGTDNSGKLLNEGTYYYVIDVFNAQGEAIEFARKQGSVLLLLDN